MKASSLTLPIVQFKTQKEWATWLSKNHAKSTGVWLQIAKKASGVPSVTYAEALDVALCYGWIDGQKDSHDDQSWLQRFTPRGPKSIWSKMNREHVARLTKAGKMTPAGQTVIDAAKADGRWKAAYAPPSKIIIPDDLQAELEKRPRAKAFFATLKSSNRYAILFRLHMAKKPETRAKRLTQFVEMLEKGEMIYPQK